MLLLFLILFFFLLRFEPRVLIVLGQWSRKRHCQGEYNMPRARNMKEEDKTSQTPIDRPAFTLEVANWEQQQLFI